MGFCDVHYIGSPLYRLMRIRLSVIRICVCLYVVSSKEKLAFASLCCPPSTKLSSFVAAVLCHRIVLRTSSFITKILCCSFTWKWRKFWLNSLSIQELKLTNTLLNSPRRRVQQFDLTSSPSLRIPQMVTYRH